MTDTRPVRDRLAHQDPEQIRLVAEQVQRLGYLSMKRGASVMHLRHADAFLLAEVALAAAHELERLHSWAGLMELLDEHWPADIFPTREDGLARDAGARIVSLLRWVGALRATVDRVRALADPDTDEPADIDDLLDALRRALDGTTQDEPRRPAACACPPCLGRGNDGHGMTHCAECCFGSGVEADEDCPVHGSAAQGEPLTACTGAGTCPAALHEHGCYADKGSCNYPDEHQGEPLTGDPGPCTTCALYGAPCRTCARYSTQKETS